MRIRRLLLLSFAAAACSGSHSDGGPILAAATIGPEGGTIDIGSGVQEGLRLVVPPGALAAPTELRIRDLTAVPSPGTYDPSSMQHPGLPFAIEPSNLQFEPPATLRAPYRVVFVFHTGAGNVRARTMRNGNIIVYDPTVVDVIHSRIELPIDYTGPFQVVQGPIAELAAYSQQPGITVPFTDDFTFAVEPVPLGSPFASPTAQRWRIAGPTGIDLLYFDAERLRGRESVTENWRETWVESYPVWTHASQSATVGSLTTTTQVSRPMTSLPLGAQMTVFGWWTWAEPRPVLEILLLDVVQLLVTLTWDRQDLGVGQRQYVFWFAPGIGLIGFAQDGVAHARLAL